MPQMRPAWLGILDTTPHAKSGPKSLLRVSIKRSGFIIFDQFRCWSEESTGRSASVKHPDGGIAQPGNGRSC
jgi:hypothetical protein